MKKHEIQLVWLFYIVNNLTNGVIKHSFAYVSYKIFKKLWTQPLCFSFWINVNKNRGFIVKRSDNRLKTITFRYGNSFLKHYRWRKRGWYSPRDGWNESNEDQGRPEIHEAKLTPWRCSVCWKFVCKTSHSIGAAKKFTWKLAVSQRSHSIEVRPHQSKLRHTWTPKSAVNVSCGDSRASTKDTLAPKLDRSTIIIWNYVEKLTRVNKDRFHLRIAQSTMLRPLSLKRDISSMNSFSFLFRLVILQWSLIL